MANPGAMAALVVAPISVGAILLVLSGAGKLRDSRPMAQALYSLGWPHHKAIVLGLGVAEMTAGVAALAWSGFGAIGVAVLYSAFAAFLCVVLLGPVQMTGCGCTGSTETPPTWAHCLLNTLVAACAAVGAGVNSPSALRVAVELKYAMPIYVVGVAVTAWLSYLLVMHAPRLFAGAYERPDPEGA